MNFDWASFFFGFCVAMTLAVLFFNVALAAPRKEQKVKPRGQLKVLKRTGT